MIVDDKNNAVLCKKEEAQLSGFTATYSNTVMCWFRLHEISCSLITFMQGCTIAECQVTVVTKFFMVKLKVKCTFVQALRSCTDCMDHRGSRGIALLFLDHSTRRGWGVSVTPWPLFTTGKDQVPNVQEAGWAPGPVWTSAQNLAPTGIQSPDHPACSQSLYWLCYPVHKFCMVVPNICGSSEWNFLYIILLTPGILRWFLDFWKIFALLYSYIHIYMHVHMHAGIQHICLHAMVSCLTILFPTVFVRFGISVLSWWAAVQTDVIHQLLQSMQTNGRICILK